MNRPWRVVCPQCGHNFVAPEVLAYKVLRVTKVEPRLRDEGGLNEPREAKLQCQATDRVLELDRAELLGELHAIRKVLAERRAAMADVQRDEAAVLKKLRELEAP